MRGREDGENAGTSHRRSPHSSECDCALLCVARRCFGRRIAIIDDASVARAAAAAHGGASIAATITRSNSSSSGFVRRVELLLRRSRR